MGEDAEAFISEFKHWREVRGLSQSQLAQEMSYHRSYLSKIEGGQERPAREFVQRAEEILKTGGALTRAFRGLEHRPARHGHDTPTRTVEPDDVPGGIIVEHDHAHLAYDGHSYRATQRRRLFNAGERPITRYPVRISVDRYPGSPERSNQLYRENPLTWDELALTAVHDDRDPMTWRVQHDRDAFKEVWLLFENDEGRFPLYPGESATISYSYTVSDTKWGHWFQRAVRLPTRRLSVELDFPTDLNPTVWGTETSMATESLALQTAIHRNQDSDRICYAWSTDSPPLHARYRLEWKFRARPATPDGDPLNTPTPSQTMASLGIVQAGDPLLARVCRRFDLPAQAEDARDVLTRIRSAMDQVAAAHNFAKGMGLSAPQIGIDHAAAIVKTPTGDLITLLNPRIVEETPDTDEQYEGCLSFFDVRGKVPRPIGITVEHHDIDGRTHLTTFEQGMARLVAHEVDHLHGLLYTARMRPGVTPIPVSEYRGTGQTWTYQ
jgi:peptide deformylase